MAWQHSLLRHPSAQEDRAITNPYEGLIFLFKKPAETKLKLIFFHSKHLAIFFSSFKDVATKGPHMYSK